MKKKIDKDRIMDLFEESTNKIIRLSLEKKLTEQQYLHAVGKIIEKLKEDIAK